MRQHDLGKWGEKIAYEYLLAQGYAIVAQNWRLGHYELDIIAQKGGLIIFVEVKTRLSAAYDPVDAVDKRKRAKMITSADAFIHKYNVPMEYRFDILAITGTEDNYTVEHIPDAFLPSLKRFNYSFRL